MNKKDLHKSQQQVSTSRSATSNYVLDLYRQTGAANQQHLTESNNNNNNKNHQEQLRKLAYEFMILRQDIDERSRLQRMDTGAENQLSPMEMSRRAAARAGLQLPELDPDLK